MPRIDSLLADLFDDEYDAERDDSDGSGHDDDDDGGGASDAKRARKLPVATRSLYANGVGDPNYNADAIQSESEPDALRPAYVNGDIDDDDDRPIDVDSQRPIIPVYGAKFVADVYALTLTLHSTSARPLRQRSLFLRCGCRAVHR
jgi:hypothetical protein